MSHALIAALVAAGADTRDAGRAAHLHAASITRGVRAAYERVNRRFGAWCAENGLMACPAEPWAVALWLFGLSDDHRPGTLAVYAHAIAWHHLDRALADPTDAPIVRRLLAAAARAHGARPHGVDSLEPSEVAAIAAVDAHRGASGPAVVARGAAAVALVRAGVGLVEACRLEASAVAVSGTEDREGRGGSATLAAPVERTLPATGAPDCPVAALRAVLRVRPAEARFLLGFGADAHLHLVALDCRPGVLAGYLRTQFRGAARRAGYAPPADLEGWVRSLDAEQAAVLVGHLNPGRWISMRNRALRLVQAGLGARHSDATVIQAESLRWTEACAIAVVPRSKTDQQGIGRTVKICHTPGCPPTCPACALQSWLAESGISTGPLFPSRWSPDTAVGVSEQGRSVKADAVRAGVGKRVGTHSFRKAHIRARAKAGATVAEISATIGSVDADVIHRHYADLRPFDGAATVDI